MDVLEAEAGRNARARTGRLLVLLGLTIGVLGASAPGEYEVKAAFLFNFAKFVEWPAGGLAAGGEFSICVAGDDGAAEKLEAVVKGRTVKGSPVTVRSLSGGVEASGCQILFSIDDSSSAEARTIAAQGVLTVGQDPDFARAGGMINFVFVDKKVRFEVNKKSAQEAGLSISSHLLKLAHEVFE